MSVKTGGGYNRAKFFPRLALVSVQYLESHIFKLVSSDVQCEDSCPTGFVLDISCNFIICYVIQSIYMRYTRTIHLQFILLQDKTKYYGSQCARINHE